MNLDHSQIVEAALIRAEAIGRAEPHPEIAMKDQAERFPAVIAPHRFMRTLRFFIGPETVIRLRSHLTTPLLFPG